LAEGLLDPARIHGELGELSAGQKAGRTSDSEITIADLTGVGVQDAAVADWVVKAAHSANLGEMIETR
jgi:ornithine cyclodeaminase